MKGLCDMSLEILTGLSASSLVDVHSILIFLIKISCASSIISQISGYAVNNCPQLSSDQYHLNYHLLPSLCYIIERSGPLVTWFKARRFEVIICGASLILILEESSVSIRYLYSYFFLFLSPVAESQPYTQRSQVWSRQYRSVTTQHHEKFG